MSLNTDSSSHADSALNRSAVDDQQFAFPQKFMVLPFDVAREIYAKTVQAGLIQSSMLASRDVSVALDAMERATLGPWARRL